MTAPPVLPPSEAARRSSASRRAGVPRVGAVMSQRGEVMTSSTMSKAALLRPCACVHPFAANGAAVPVAQGARRHWATHTRRRKASSFSALGRGLQLTEAPASHGFMKCMRADAVQRGDGMLHGTTVSAAGDVLQVRGVHGVSAQSGWMHLSHTRCDFELAGAAPGKQCCAGGACGTWLRWRSQRRRRPGSCRPRHRSVLGVHPWQAACPLEGTPLHSRQVFRGACQGPYTEFWRPHVTVHCTMKCEARATSFKAITFHLWYVWCAVNDVLSCALPHKDLAHKQSLSNARWGARAAGRQPLQGRRCVGVPPDPLLRAGRQDVLHCCAAGAEGGARHCLRRHLWRTGHHDCHLGAEVLPASPQRRLCCAATRCEHSAL